MNRQFLPLLGLLSLLPATVFAEIPPPPPPCNPETCPFPRFPSSLPPSNIPDVDIFLPQPFDDCPNITNGVRFPYGVDISEIIWERYPKNQTPRRICHYSSNLEPTTSFLGFQISLPAEGAAYYRPRLYFLGDGKPCDECQIIENGKVFNAKDTVNWELQNEDNAPDE